jgi:hypothetical protein
MIFKSLKSSRNARGDQSSAGGIVVLMMTLVFVPIIAVHVAVAWHDQLAGIDPQRLAAIVGAFLPAF